MLYRTFGRDVKVVMLAIIIAPMVTIAYIYEKTVRKKRPGQPAGHQKK